MKVYLIRHAQSEENILDLDALTTIPVFNEILRKSHDTPLTEQGQQQARDLIAKLSHARIERLYSSPFNRALTTATVLGKALDLEPQIIDDLREVLPRSLNEAGRARTLRRHFIQSYTRMLWPWGRDETWAAAYRRGRRAWAKITAEPAVEIAAVAHRGLITMILLSLRRSSRWRVLNQDLSNGGISVVASRNIPRAD